MRLLILCMLFTGVVLILVNELVRKPPRVIEFRYLPRPLDTYLRESTKASLIYGDMAGSSIGIDPIIDKDSATT